MAAAAATTTTAEQADSQAAAHANEENTTTAAAATASNNQTDLMEPISLETNDSSGVSSDEDQAPCGPTPADHRPDDGGVVWREPEGTQPKCSAVHTLERDMPDCDYSHLVAELRARILDEIQGPAGGAGLYSQQDIERCQRDDWFLARFLLRHKLDLELALDQLRRTMRFNHDSLTHFIKAEDFPQEFYQLGGLFTYEPDRKGNRMLYMRVRVHRKTPEIAAVVQAFVHFNTLKCDREAAGRGMAIVIDCTGGGLQNADMELLFFFIHTLRNYFPKGLSYILVHNLPWILKPFWHIAKMWVPDEHRELIKFSNEATIFEYVARERLPDFLGGTCPLGYREPPPNCTHFMEAAKLWGVDKATARKLLAKFEECLPAETVARCRQELLADATDEGAAAAADQLGPPT